MNKKEYIDILEDYLNANVTCEDREDILRDVKEMIEDGIMSGKLEEDVINQLGSPKQLVAELKGEEVRLNKEKVQEMNGGDDKEASENKGLLYKIKSQFKKIKKNMIVRDKKRDGLVKRILAFVGLPLIICLSIAIIVTKICIACMAGLGITVCVVMAGIDVFVCLTAIFGIIICIGLELILCDIYNKVSGWIKPTIKCVIG